MSSFPFTDHFPLLVLLATLVASFLALLWRETRRERWRFFAKIWLGLMGGSVAAGWLMSALPHR